MCGAFLGNGYTDDVWTDRVDDGGRLSRPSALTVAGTRLFVAAALGCSPAGFDECLLAVRACDPKSGILLWNQVDRSPGHDWFVNTIVANGQQVFVGGE